MNANTGKLLDSFTLLIDGHETAAEIRLVIADNGTEMLHHYEAGRFVLAHPAARCHTCNDLITGSHVGRNCTDCAAELNLN